MAPFNSTQSVIERNYVDYLSPSFSTDHHSPIAFSLRNDLETRSRTSLDMRSSLSDLIREFLQAQIATSRCFVESAVASSFSWNSFVVYLSCLPRSSLLI